MKSPTFVARRMRRIVVSFSLLALALATTPADATCPGSLVFEPSGSSTIDHGWKGILHQQPLLGWQLAMKIASCPNASGMTCGDCTIAGLIPNALANNQRCTNDAQIVCADDADCAASPGLCSGNGASCATNANCSGGQTCVRRCAFYTSPPIPLAFGGVSVCLTSEITAAASGTTNVEQGSLTAQLPLHTDLYLGALIDNPCPRCLGDATPDDGLKNGTCNGGANNNSPCDAGSTTDNRPDFGRTSFDCAPSRSSLLGTLADSSSPITVTTGTAIGTLSTANPVCSGELTSRCFCDTCNNANQQPCSTNADCPISGGNPGICGGRRCRAGANNGAPCSSSTACPGGSCSLPGEPTRPDGCIDDTNGSPQPACDDPDSDGVGQCTFGPLDQNCTVASGHPQRGCTMDSDCGGGLNSCDATYRLCFPDGGLTGNTRTVSGTATPPTGGVASPVTLAALYCAPPTTIPAANNVMGLPGPGRQKVTGTLTYAGDVGELNIGTVSGGGTVSSDGENDGATAADPIETSVTTSSAAGGEVTIFETTEQTPPPVGYAILGAVTQITAPSGTTTAPLTFTFLLDSTLVAGRTLPELELRRNGVIVPPCTAVPPAAINPNPCVFDRAFVGDDAQIRAYSSSASDWDVVVLQPLCGAAPDVCRTPTVGGKAYLAISNKNPSTKSQLQWKWASGSATDKADFGDPIGTHAYALCIYDQTGLRATLNAPPGGDCAGKDCWADKPKGFQYKDKDLTPNGIAQLQLSSGADGKAKIQVKGKGANLPVINLNSLVAPIQVQLKRSGSPICWGATYSDPPSKNDGSTFKDKAD